MNLERFSRGVIDVAYFTDMVLDWRYTRFGSHCETDPKTTVLETLEKGNWHQDTDGNWILDVPDVWVYHQLGVELPFSIAVCPDTLPSQHKDFIRSLTRMSLGFKTDVTYLNHGTKSWGGKFTYSHWDLCAVYMDVVNLTGIERLTSTNLLAIATEDGYDVNVPKPIFATTNFYVSPYIHGYSCESQNHRWNAIERLVSIADTLTRQQKWECGIWVDAYKNNFLTSSKGVLYNVDPVAREDSSRE